MDPAKLVRTSMEVVSFGSLLNIRSMEENLAETFDENVVVDSPYGVHVGLEAVTSSTVGWKVSCPTMSDLKTEFFALNDNVLLNRWSFDGVHEGDFFGVAPTGKRLHFNGLALYRLNEGKIVHFTNMVDLGAVFSRADIPITLPQMSTSTKDSEQLGAYLSGRTHLSHKQLSYLSYWIHGYSARDIAAKFDGSSPRTIEFHLDRALERLGCRTRRLLVEYFNASGDLPALRALHDRLADRWRGR